MQFQLFDIKRVSLAEQRTHRINPAPACADFKKNAVTIYFAPERPAKNVNIALEIDILPKQLNQLRSRFIFIVLRNSAKNLQSCLLLPLTHPVEKSSGSCGSGTYGPATSSFERPVNSRIFSISGGISITLLSPKARLQHFPHC